MGMKELAVNNILKSVENGHLYRVLWVSTDRTETYIFDTETLEMPLLVLYVDLQKQIGEGIFTVEDSDPYLTVVAESDLSSKEIEARDELWAIMKNIVLDEPQIFTKRGRGKLVSEVTAASGKNRMSVHRHLKTYWKGGKTRDAFVPMFRRRGGLGKERGSGESKRGRPRKYDDNVGVNVDDAVKAIFEKAVGKYYHTRKENTLQYTYDMMIKDYYTSFTTQVDGKIKAELVSKDRIPTIGQFRYWYRKNHDVKEQITKRKGESKFNRDHRAVVGKSDYGIMGPGAKYEIDATIGDIYLVSRFVP